MVQGFVTYRQSHVHYCCFGNGPELLLALHGYGEKAASFTILEHYIAERFTVLAIDFPFHNKTDWQQGLLFTAADLISIIQSITPTAKQPFTLLGYSMGGRVSLHLLQQYPHLVKQIVLVAPDGLHHNIWHKIATQTLLGNKLFLFTMQFPGWLFYLMKTVTVLGLFNKSVFNFVQYHLKEKESRLILYKRWTTMRKLTLNIALLKSIIQKHKVPVSILFGRHDKIIVTKRGVVFQKGIEQYVSIKEIEAGHQLLKEKYALQITALFKA